MFDVILTSLLSAGIVSVVLFTGLHLFKKQLWDVVDSIGEMFASTISTPAVSKAMGILGKKSGESRANSAIVDQLASDVLSGPKFSAMKMGASALGINIDEYIEDHGAVGTLQGLQTIAGALGIDINQIIGGGMGELTGGSSGGQGNPYL